MSDGRDGVRLGALRALVEGDANSLDELAFALDGGQRPSIRPDGRGLTVDELSQSTGWPVYVMEQVLEDCALVGFVVRGDDGRWRLSHATEREFGDALRTLPGLLSEEGVYS